MVMGSIPERVDVAVIGGGVGGYVAAIRAAQLGKSVALIEKNKLGGHCLNYACIPSKTMIHVADVLYTANNSQEFGITGKVGIDGKKLNGWRMSVSKKLEDGVGFLCKSNGVETFKAEATFLSSNKLQLTDGVEIEFGKAIIATGSEPVELAGFSFSESIIDYKRALMLDYVPKSVAIEGGGYVAVELGTMFAKLGSKVSIIARSELLSKFDKDAVAIIRKRMLGLGVAIYENSAPSAYADGKLTLGDGKQLEAELLVVAIGLKPFTGGLGLENTKVEMDSRSFIKVDASLRTSDPDIFAVGDVIGEPMLAHKAIRQGVVAGEAASGTRSEFSNQVIPAVIFSDPEIAIAGKMDGEGVQVKKFPLSALGRAIALDATDGFAKIAYDSRGIVVGVEVVSDEANAMISEAALAIEMGATLEDIADTIHPHPTYSESIQEAAEAALGRGIHFFYGK